MGTDSAVEVRSAEARDFETWKTLYAGYQAFYGVAGVEADITTVFDWILDPSHPQSGLVSVHGDTVTGLANFQVNSNPMTARYRVFLNDLFVAPSQRRRGHARALIESLAILCRENQFESLRWMTANDNVAARALYDQYATALAFKTYEIKFSVSAD